MKRLCYVLAVAALAATALPFQAQAYCRGCAVGAGAIGGVAAGAIVGSAIANGAQAPGPAPAYGAPPPPDGSEAMDSAVCQTRKQRVWVDGRGYRWTNTEVCD